MSSHPWSILPALVTAEILTREDARSIVMAHESVMRQTLMEIRALLPELLARDEITEKGASRIQTVVQRTAERGMPNYA